MCATAVPGYVYNHFLLEKEEPVPQTPGIFITLDLHFLIWGLFFSIS